MKYYKYSNPIILCDYVGSIITDDVTNYYLLINKIQMNMKTIDK